MSYSSFNELFQQNSDASAIPVVFETENAPPGIGSVGGFVPQSNQPRLFDKTSHPNGSVSTGAVSKAAAPSPANTDKAAIPNDAMPEQPAEDPRFAEVNQRLNKLEAWQGTTTKWQGEVTKWQGEVTKWQGEVTSKIDEGFGNMREWQEKWQEKVDNGFQQIRDWQEKFDQKHPS